MKKILITGGTVFVSKFVSSYYVKKGYDVYVLNRNNHKQVEGVTLIEGDRHNLKDKLKKYSFDAVLDITAYTKEDVKSLVEALGEFKDYILISSSAVYPETLKQPFKEEQQVGPNIFWKDYGVNKLEAENYLRKHVPQSYILRPPYLYGPMENLYREPFVFDCAMEDRPFYVPKDGKMILQFFHVNDLCKFLDILMEKHPKEHIFNVGNENVVDINEWVKLCYEAVGKKAEIINVYEDYNVRKYFPFHDYGYKLDVSKQKELMGETKDLGEGLKETYAWYIENKDDVNKRNYIDFIREYF